MKTLIFGLVVFAVVVIVVAAAFGKRGFLPRYKAKTLMTNNELEFFHRIRRAAIDGHVFAQVAMSALIEPAVTNGKEKQTAFRRISQKRVDYAVCDASMNLLAVIELDDRTHNSRKDAERDAFLESAGIKTIRYESKNKPTVDEIRGALVKIMAQSLAA